MHLICHKSVREAFLWFLEIIGTDKKLKRRSLLLEQLPESLNIQTLSQLAFNHSRQITVCIFLKDPGFGNSRRRSWS